MSIAAAIGTVLEKIIAYFFGVGLGWTICLVIYYWHKENKE